MHELGQLPSRADFADVAILGPVPTLGAKTPLMVSGPGSGAVADLLAPLGADIEIADGEPGTAMAHKLLRSVLMKGLASVVVEAVTAGRAAGLEDWIRAQIAGQLAGDGQAVIDRFITGTAKHALRRSKEMQDTASYLSGPRSAGRDDDRLRRCPDPHGRGNGTGGRCLALTPSSGENQWTGINDEPSQQQEFPRQERQHDRHLGPGSLPGRHPALDDAAQAQRRGGHDSRLSGRASLHGGLRRHKSDGQRCTRP